MNALVTRYALLDKRAEVLALALAETRDCSVFQAVAGSGTNSVRMQTFEASKIGTFGCGTSRTRFAPLHYSPNHLSD